MAKIVAHVPVDFSNTKSIHKAERLKKYYENQNFTLKKTTQKGLQKFVLTYEKKLK